MCDKFEIYYKIIPKYFELIGEFSKMHEIIQNRITVQTTNYIDNIQEELLELFHIPGGIYSVLPGNMWRVRNLTERIIKLYIDDLNLYLDNKEYKKLVRKYYDMFYEIDIH